LPVKWWKKVLFLRRSGAARPRRINSISFCIPCSIQPLAKSLQKIPPACRSPGAAVGRAAFSSEDAVEMSAKGPVVLVRKENYARDIHGMDVSKGILTAVGGLTSHAPVVARGHGTACVVGAASVSVDESKKTGTISMKARSWC